MFRISFVALTTELGPNRESHNERVKLIATSLNAAGLAGFVTGVLAPLFDAARPFRRSMHWLALRCG
jgi:Na+/melibiose symporter-like transporter